MVSRDMEAKGIPSALLFEESVYRLTTGCCSALGAPLTGVHCDNKNGMEWKGWCLLSNASSSPSPDRLSFVRGKAKLLT